MKYSLDVNYVDIAARRTYAAEVEVVDGKISEIKPLSREIAGRYLCPGFVDAHVHIESSMLIPAEFARLALTHGTLGTVSDPHEIANVCGIEGVNFMIRNGREVPFRFCFGAPSCVPATVFETAGAELDAGAVSELLQREDIYYLTEVMNFPGVIHDDPGLMAKIAAAERLGKPIDGHAPALRAEGLRKYIAAGISTDHECFTADEAEEKLAGGMKIQIREGSAARNFDALISLLDKHYEQMMFCSDDKHPDNLLEGHINKLCARAVQSGQDLYKVLQVACVNPVKHYNMGLGLLQPGDSADFILLEDLRDFNVLQAYMGGELVAGQGRALFSYTAERLEPVNNFSCSKKDLSAFHYPADADRELPVIGVEDGQLITSSVRELIKAKDGYLQVDTERDLLKLVVVNRYEDKPLSMAFIKNFGMKHGAMASSIAHDSHNVIAVGCDDESLFKAVNAVIDAKGGISYADESALSLLRLPVAGLMSMEPGPQVAARYSELDRQVKAAGCTLRAPYMSLSFMALLVIPELKLSDKGLFDGIRFSFVDE